MEIVEICQNLEKKLSTDYDFPPPIYVGGKCLEQSRQLKEHYKIFQITAVPVVHKEQPGTRTKTIIHKHTKTIAELFRFQRKNDGKQNESLTSNELISSLLVGDSFCLPSFLRWNLNSSAIVLVCL